MWSLSVEEQFYIIFPLVLFLYLNLEKLVFIYIVIFSVLSLSNTLNFGNSVFYQLQFRIWEFLFGVMFMFLESKLSFKKNTKYIGLFIIVFSFIFFDDSIINNLFYKINLL